MKRIKSITEKISRVLESINRYILIFSLAILVVAVVMQVLLRVVFRTSFVPLSDIISYSFPITTFTGAALLFKKADGHIAITFLTDMLNGKIGKILHYICEFFTYVVLIYILLWGVQFAFNGQFQFSPALNIKLIYVFSVVPLFALSGLVFKLEKLLVK